MSRTYWSTLLASVAIIAPFSEAFAQSADADGSQPEIVVTAQKRLETIDRVPLTVSAVSQVTLDKQGVKNVADLARTTPGLTFRTGNTFDNPSLSIRGISSSIGAATTGVYIDEVPITARSICFFCGSTAFPQLFDLQRVEVLKGPQGTLFGSGSEGGTVRFLTPEPSLSEISGYGRAEASTTRFGDPSYEAGLAVGGPLVQDKLGIRASFWSRKDGGFIDRVDRFTGEVLDKNVNDLKSYVGRVSLKWKPTEQLSITPAVYYQRNETRGRNFYKINQGLYQSDRLIREPGNDRQIIGSLNVTYEGDSVNLTSVTSYYDRKQGRVDDYSEVESLVYSGGTVAIIPGYVAANELTTTQKNWTQELRASSKNDGPIDWTVGLYFASNRSTLLQGTRQDLDILTNALYDISALDFFGVPQVGPFSYVDNQRQKDTELAAFGQASYAVTDRLKISLGARLSRVKFRTALVRSGPEAGGDVNVGADQSSTPFTPKATISYQTPSTLFYASAAKGFRVGGGNTSVKDIGICGADLATLGKTDVPASYGADQVWSYEVGFKSRIAGGKGRVAGSAFRIDWDKIQSSVLLPTCLYDYVDNVGKARSQGFELEGSIEPVKGLTLSGSLAYTDAKYTQSYFSGSTQLIAKGQALAVSPLGISASGEYEFDVTGETQAYFRTDYQYSSAISRGLPGLNGYDPLTSRLPALNQFSLRTGLRRDKFDLSLFVNNLFDSRTRMFIQRDGTTSTQFRATTVRPRTIGLTLTGRF